MGNYVRERRANILGQKVPARRQSSAKVRVHDGKKARTGAEKTVTVGLHFLATAAHPPARLRKGGRGQKNEDSTTLQDRADPWTTGRQAPYWPTPQRRGNPRALKNLFRYCRPVFHCTYEAGRFSLGQMKLAGILGTNESCQLHGRFLCPTSWITYQEQFSVAIHKKRMEQDRPPQAGLYGDL